MFIWENLNCPSQVETFIYLLRFQIYIHIYNSYLEFSKKAFAKRHTFVEEKWVRLSTESVHSLHLLEDYFFLDIAQAPFLYQSSNLIFTSAFIDVSRTKFNPIMRRQKTEAFECIATILETFFVQGFQLQCPSQESAFCSSSPYTNGF